MSRSNRLSNSLRSNCRYFSTAKTILHNSSCYLQNIDANFSKIQQIMANRILPAVKRYAVGTEPIRDAAKVCLPFNLALMKSSIDYSSFGRRFSSKPLKSAYLLMKITVPMKKHRQKRKPLPLRNTRRRSREISQRPLGLLCLTRIALPPRYHLCQDRLLFHQRLPRLLDIVH